MTDIPDEAVDAAARARFDSAHYVDAWPSLPARERQRWLEQTRPWVTAAAPLIAAQATADLRARIEALRDEWRGEIDWSDGRNNYGDNAAWERAAAALDALIGGAK